MNDWTPERLREFALDCQRAESYTASPFVKAVLADAAVMAQAFEERLAAQSAYAGKKRGDRA